MKQEQPANPPAAAIQSSPRLASLDAFRGLTIVGMLLVNNVSLDVATPKNLTHAAWNAGVHFADLVLPWFLFIVGVAIPYAAASFKKKQLPTWRYYQKAVGRTIVLVLLGCLIHSSLQQRPVLELGVLQIIGLSYLVATFLYPLGVGPRLGVAGLLLVSHWAAIRFLALPGLAAGVFTESDNLIAHINTLYLQPIHLQGLVSLVPTAALVLIGTAVGDVLRSSSWGQLKKFLCLLAGGVLLALAGWLWNLDLPFNKPVWTASYILYCAGLGAITLSLLYLVIDVWRWRAWAFPLVVFGTNAIVAYVAPILTKLYIFGVWKWTFADGTQLPLQQALLKYLVTGLGPITGGWTYTICYILFWWLVLLELYRRKLFLRV